MLDVLDIPIEGAGPDFGFECENWAIAPGPWSLLHRASIQDLISHIEFHTPILHTESRYVTTDYLQALPFEDRRTLQLIYADRIRVSCQEREGGGNKWKANITTASGQTLRHLTITDPEFADLLDRGLEPNASYLLTVSLSMPRKPLDWEEDAPDPCWKLIAGVIRLPLRDQILVEMQRLGWSIHQGRQHLLKTYGKCSRSELTDDEAGEFIHHLKHLKCQDMAVMV